MSATSKTCHGSCEVRDPIEVALCETVAVGREAVSLSVKEKGLVLTSAEDPEAMLVTSCKCFETAVDGRKVGDCTLGCASYLCHSCHT